VPPNFFKRPEGCREPKKVEKHCFIGSKVKLTMTDYYLNKCYQFVEVITPKNIIIELAIRAFGSQSFQLFWSLN
jgi:hypothetical protein